MRGNDSEDGELNQLLFKAATVRNLKAQAALQQILL